MPIFITNSQKNSVIFAFRLIFLLSIIINSNCKLFNKVNSIENTISRNVIKFRTLSSKCLIEYKDNTQTHTFTADFVCYYDSVIYLNIKLPLGINAAKIKIQDDSTYFKYGLNNTNYKLSTKVFFKSYNYNIDYSIIQNLLIANLYAYPDSNNLNNYKYKIDSIKHISYKLKDSVYPYYTIYEHNFNIKNNLIISSNISDYTKFAFLKAKYDYQNVNNKFFPKFIFLQLIQKDTVYIKIRFKNVKINTYPNINF